MSKTTNTNRIEHESIKTKIMNYFEKYGSEIMCGLMSMNGTMDYEVLSELRKK
ncbi:MAG: hypothetical protein SPF19_09145 [Oliverpabstia sp.]|nr:hypothetical protein [Lachnospiraceae bacterium]MDY5026668.1 hypothetical protein [Oliverpabstia sp.]